MARRLAKGRHPIQDSAQHDVHSRPRRHRVVVPCGCRPDQLNAAAGGVGLHAFDLDRIASIDAPGLDEARREPNRNATGHRAPVVVGHGHPDDGIDLGFDSSIGPPLTPRLENQAVKVAVPLGGLQQAAEANLYTGAFTVSVPIEIPPGRSQVTPDLRLRYLSSDGDGPLGRGWTLPLGQIQRNTKNGVPRCKATIGFDFTDDFVLVLNGNSHELVLDTGSSYRPRIDNSFLEATKNVAANTWEVVDRAGRRYRFGTAPDARLWINSDTFLNSTSCSFTSVWGLTEIEDPYGNLVKITYAAGLDYLIPEKIEYGGTASTAHPFRFTTVTHPRPVVSYRLGVNETLNRLIGQIVVEARLSQGAQFTPVRTYTLTYNHPAGVALFSWTLFGA